VDTAAERVAAWVGRQYRSREHAAEDGPRHGQAGCRDNALVN
jgi:hypothetical protein